MDGSSHYNIGTLCLISRCKIIPCLRLQAVELRPDFDSALFNLALLLSDAGRPLEAAPFLHQLVRHQPDHIKALILLGDIYVSGMRDLNAAERVGADRSSPQSGPFYQDALNIA